MDQPGKTTDSRLAALALLAGVLDGGRMLGDLTEDPDGPLAAVAPPVKARARRLAAATLRHRSRADAVLAPHLRRAPPARIGHILRLATVEMCELGGDAHGVVSSAVAAARGAPGGDRFAGLVNAVLRKVAVDGPARWPDLPPQRLPGWLRGRLSSAYGNAAVARIEAVQATAPPLDLTPRDPGAAAALAETLGAETLPTGSLRLPAGRQVSALPGYDDGAWWVQDAAAALPALALAARPGERVLDLCAAPGGKTLQLAAAGARVTALDLSDRRLGRLRENLARTGLEAEIVVADARDWRGGPFDAILVDAPCTATGTIRRHPDLPFVRQASDLKALVALQREMLARAAGLLAPGGRLVYCTCSLLPEEGEAQARALLQEGRLVAAPDLTDLPGLPDGAQVAEGLRLRPDMWAGRGGIDGFFVAAFRRA